jgi:CheY-like chemotaxis protein
VRQPLAAAFRASVRTVPGDSDEASKKDPHRDVTGALHDVSNALTVMLGWVSEARSEGATRESVDYALRIIEHRAKIARDLARRAIGAYVTIDDREDTLEAALDDATEALKIEAIRMGVSLTRRGELRAVRVPLAGDVSQIVTNLLMNAIAHAPRGSEVAIAVEVNAARVILEVQDEGPGVPPSRRISIFEGDSSREGGAGVGLRHARAVARAAGGDLELVAQQSGPGAGGACFRLVWPRAEVMPPPPVSVPRLKLFEGTRVLVVEDDAHVTQLLEAALTARGAEVTIARNTTELAAALTQPPHDAVLIDLSPIAADVEGAFASLQSSCPRATMVVISGSAEALPDVMQRAPVRFVRKPFEVSEIVTALASGQTRQTQSGPPDQDRLHDGLKK